MRIGVDTFELIKDYYTKYTCAKNKEIAQQPFIEKVTIERTQPVVEGLIIEEGVQPVFENFELDKSQIVRAEGWREFFFNTMIKVRQPYNKRGGKTVQYNSINWYEVPKNLTDSEIECCGELSTNRSHQALAITNHKALFAKRNFVNEDTGYQLQIITPETRIIPPLRDGGDNVNFYLRNTYYSAVLRQHELWDEPHEAGSAEYYLKRLNLANRTFFEQCAIAQKIGTDIQIISNPMRFIRYVKMKCDLQMKCDPRNPTPNFIQSCYMDENTGYNTYLIAADTVIMPPTSARRLPEYVAAVNERTSERIADSIIWKYSNFEELKRLGKQAVKGYHKVDSFEKLTLIRTGTLNPDLHYEPVEIANGKLFITEVYKGYLIGAENMKSLMFLEVDKHSLLNEVTPPIPDGFLDGRSTSTTPYPIQLKYGDRMLEYPAPPIPNDMEEVACFARSLARGAGGDLRKEHDLSVLVSAKIRIRPPMNEQLVSPPDLLFVLETLSESTSFADLFLVGVELFDRIIDKSVDTQ